MCLHEYLQLLEERRLWMSDLLIFPFFLYLIGINVYICGCQFIHIKKKELCVI